MRRCMANPAGQGGVPRRLADRLDGSEHTQNRRAMQCSAELDEVLYRLRRAISMGRLEGWERDFAKSVVGQSKRCHWNPSTKQLATMRRLIAGLAEPDTGPLVDDGDGHGTAA